MRDIRTWQEQENIGLELGGRAYRALCSENCDPYRYIEGISDLFYQTDTSDDWSDIVAMSHIDRLQNFDLMTGVAIIGGDLMEKWGLSKDEAIDELEIWEARGGTLWDWELEDEWQRERDFEEAIARGDYDEELEYGLLEPEL